LENDVTGQFQATKLEPVLRDDPRSSFNRPSGS
jgi:hypothetical protein